MIVIQWNFINRNKKKKEYRGLTLFDIFEKEKEC
jgi:hypothetical protein